MSQRTAIRLEKGEPGVSLQALAMALLALGEIRRLHDLLDIATDETGLSGLSGNQASIEAAPFFGVGLDQAVSTIDRSQEPPKQDVV